MQKCFVIVLILFGCCPVKAGDTADHGFLSRKLTLVNSISYQQYGICYAGKVSIGEISKKLALFQAEEEKKVLFQSVLDPDEETCSLYVDINHSDPDYYVLPYSSLELVPEKRLPDKSYFKSTLSINAETGEMGNDKIWIKIDKMTGAISSLKHCGVDHDLVDVSGEGKNGLNECRFPSGPKSVKLTQITDGPLVAVMLVERVFSETVILKTQITVFADSEKFRIENFGTTPGFTNAESQFSFPFQIPEGQWRVEPDYLCYYGEDYGIDWLGPHLNKVEINGATVTAKTPPDSGGVTVEYWIWPYFGSFSEEVAGRFARKVQNPLRMDGEK